MNTHLFLKNILFVLCLFLLMFCISLPASAEEKLKVGFIYVSSIGDAGWTYQHDLIFTTSFGYMNPTLKVEKIFSKKIFWTFNRI